MRFYSLIVSAFALFLASIPTPADAAKRPWLRAKTHHFVIYSSGTRKQLEDFATTMEKFDATLRLTFGFPEEDQPVPLTIYMLSTQDEVSDLIGDKKGFVAGFYHPSREGSFAVSNRESATNAYVLDAEVVLFHEYAHHVTFHQLNFPYPDWYTEGFAEYLSTVSFDKAGIASIGRPAQHRAAGLFYGDEMKIATVLYGDREKFTSAQRDEFYGRSWLLVHYLRDSGKRPDQLHNYLLAISKGIPAQEAAEQSFGDLKQLDRELRGYMNGKLSYHKTLKPVEFRRELAITALDPIESQLVMLAARRKTNREIASVRNELAALAAAQPQRAAIWLELAHAELAVWQQDEAAMKGLATAAEAAVDRALAADPSLPRANALKAELAFYRLRESGDDTPASWRAARALLVKANAADTEDPVPLYNWYQSYAIQGKEPSKVARDALEKAFSLQPEVAEVRATFAIDLARQDKFDQALRLARLMANDPHNPEYGQHVLKQIEAMRSITEKVKENEAKAAPKPEAVKAP